MWCCGDLALHLGAEQGLAGHGQASATSSGSSRPSGVLIPALPTPPKLLATNCPAAMGSVTGGRWRETGVRQESAARMGAVGSSGGRQSPTLAFPVSPGRTKSHNRGEGLHGPWVESVSQSHLAPGIMLGIPCWVPEWSLWDPLWGNKVPVLSSRGRCLCPSILVSQPGEAHGACRCSDLSHWALDTPTPTHATLPWGSKPNKPTGPVLTSGVSGHLYVDHSPCRTLGSPSSGIKSPRPSA